ncbi:MAG: CRISPR-associated endonuclease Cas2 [Nautiliaceae bacterium]
MVVIAYDITDEKRLKKVAKYLESCGIRIQKSVFEVDMSVREVKKIKELLEGKDRCFLFKFDEREDIHSGKN